jgi:8-oxo-dGTP pyrophosphatase MutT (NUDIX family)
MLDPRLAEVRHALAAYASDADDPAPLPGDVVDAAVAVVLRARPEDVELLLIKRARHPRDPWSGHMALPGGRRDTGDPDLAATAIRETFEETGVELTRDPPIEPLGSLERVAPLGAPLPRIRISPFVFAVASDTEAHAASAEVDRVHWTSVRQLRDPAAHDRVRIEVPGGARPFPCYRVHGEIVWGLTYRILTDFLGRLNGD